MERLTEKGMTYDSCSVMNKLSQYEDIEEELGIDLTIILKPRILYCLTDIITYEKVGSAVREKVLYNQVICSRILLVDFRNKRVAIAKKRSYSWFNIKDYGVTWALTKEELLPKTLPNDAENKR